jgi:CRISPR system Cascade subunit CasB
MTVSTRPEARFAAYLKGFADREDRASLAALRRALGKSPGEAAEAHRYVVPWLPPSASRRQEEAYYLVAALFAWHQGSWPPTSERDDATNLGASLRRLAGRTEGESVERRLTVLLNSHPEDLARHLRHVVGLLKAHEVPIDWAQLLRNVQDWHRLDRRVQRAWAKAFWGYRTAPDDPTADPHPISPNGDIA